MSKKRYIDTNFWSDTWVDQLSTLEKFFFLYLLTNDRTSIAGIYEIPMKRMKIETDLSAAEISRMMSRMKSKVRYIDGWIVLRNAIKSQNYRNDKIGRGIKAILEECPVELLQFVDLPKDLGFIIERVEKEPQQQRLIDDSSMTLDETLHLNSNLIKYNSNRNSNAGSGKPEHPPESDFVKTVKTPAQKHSYAIAMEKEREQEKRAKEASTRKPSAPSNFDTLRDNVRGRKR